MHTLQYIDLEEALAGMFLSVPLLFAWHSWLQTIAKTESYGQEAPGLEASRVAARLERTRGSSWACWRAVGWRTAPKMWARGGRTAA